jgi:hypothetical protein
MVNRSKIPDAKDFQGSGNGGAPNQVIEKKLPFSEDICKPVPSPAWPGVEGKPEFVK